MPDVVKLKKKAADFELKKQFEKALAVYVEILDSYDTSDQEVDVSLFNRVGDLYLKQGSVGDAVDYYEQAVDRYAEGGFHNNAIALCNKILRNSPGRASVYYKLGKISAQKGFKSDAKKNFLEYADRMQASGKIDEAFRALKEFADLCPDQDDIRLMLAEQLSKQGRSEEAIEQLQLLYVRYSHEGRSAEARATIERMKTIDPAAEPRELGAAPSHSSAGLVFLDLDDQAPVRRAQVTKRATQGLDIIASGDVDAIRPPPASAVDPHATPLVSPAVPFPAQARPDRIADILETPAMEPAVLDGLTRSDEFERNSGGMSTGGLLDGLESTSFDVAEPSTSGDLLDFEPTSFASAPSAPSAAGDAPADEFLDLDMAPAEPREASPSSIDFGEIDLDGDVSEARESAPARGSSPSLAGLPMLGDDEEIGVASETEVADDGDHGQSIGGELEFIMPDGTPASGTQAMDEVPFMDLDLPHPGEAAGDLSRNSVELEAVEPDLPASDELPLHMIDLPVADSQVADDDIDGGEGLDQDFDAMRTPAPARRQSTVIAAQDVGLLQALSEADPDDHSLRRRLAEAMLESGDRDGGLRELETAMVGFERNDDLVAAAKLADEIVLLNPASVRHHQKRVEYAFRTDDRAQLIEAYLQLADALFRAAQVEKSRAIYQRVIDLSPEDLRAQAALESFPDELAADAPATPASRQTVGIPRSSTPIAAGPAAGSTPDDEFINLGDWLRDDEAPKDTRMVVAEQEPTGDEEADFQDMLKKFKQGISENVEEEDHQSHYDLGVAFKEMGLLDEAISEFQKALRAPANRVPTYEALGLCFIEKEQYPMAATILGRALHESGMSESQLIGVLYLLGRCAQERGQRDAAIEYYQRVFVVDIQFQDVGERLAAVEGAAT
jgi:tetratricopeptide (TPR) repeat protein